MKQISIGGACLNQTPIDWENNLANIKNAIQQAQGEGVNILCLPELCITGYGCEDLFLSDWLYQKALEKLLELQPICKQITVAIGLPIKFDGHNYNSTCLIKDGEILGFYCKQILANDGIHYEKRWFESWPFGIEEMIYIDGQQYPIGDITFQLYGYHVGLEICEDAWNKERPAYQLYEKRVDLIINPSASHFAFGKCKARESLVVNSSKDFECYYLYVNQLGNESGRVIYDGDIMLAHKGKLLGKNKRFSFQPINLLRWDIGGADDVVGETTDPFGDKMEEFPRAVSLALFDYLRKSNSSGFTLSLSGGADSSAVAVLVAEMVKNAVSELGIKTFTKVIHLPEKAETAPEIVNLLLHTAYQGTVNSSVETLKSARAVARSIGARFYQWDIDTTVTQNQQTIEKALGRELSWATDDIAMQNIQARTRSPLIWMMANLTNTILLTTSNRSEGDVGYATMDGDTSGSLAPIAGVDKPFLLEWLKYAEQNLGYYALRDVNSLTPSAELRPQDKKQSDEDDLMPYPILKEIELLAIRDRKPPIEVFEVLKHSLEIDEPLLKKYIRRFFNLWAQNQWKRERIAPSFHLDDFNVDPRSWCRFPILSGNFRTELNDLK